MFARLLIFVGIAETAVGRRREAVEFDPAVGEQAEGAEFHRLADPRAIGKVDRNLPIAVALGADGGVADTVGADIAGADAELGRAERRGAELAIQQHRIARANFGAEAAGGTVAAVGGRADRKSTRLNSSHYC